MTIGNILAKILADNNHYEGCSKSECKRIANRILCDVINNYIADSRYKGIIKSYVDVCNGYWFVKIYFNGDALASVNAYAEVKTHMNAGKKRVSYISNISVAGDSLTPIEYINKCLAEYVARKREHIADTFNRIAEAEKLMKGE